MRNKPFRIPQLDLEIAKISRALQISAHFHCFHQCCVSTSQELDVSSLNLKNWEREKKKTPLNPMLRLVRSQLGVLTMEKCRLQLQGSKIKALEVNSFQKWLTAALKIAILRVHGPPRRAHWPSATLLTLEASLTLAIHLCLRKPGSTNHMASHWLSVRAR